MRKCHQFLEISNNLCIKRNTQLHWWRISYITTMIKLQTYVNEDHSFNRVRILWTTYSSLAVWHYRFCNTRPRLSCPAGTRGRSKDTPSLRPLLSAPHCEFHSCTRSTRHPRCSSARPTSTCCRHPHSESWCTSRNTLYCVHENSLSLCATSVKQSLYRVYTSVFLLFATIYLSTETCIW